MILVFCETGDDAITKLSRQALAFAAGLPGAEAGVGAVVVDDGDVFVEDVADDAARHGASVVHVLDDALLANYGPETWGQAVAQVVDQLAPEVVVAAASARGGEVLAHVAARLDEPLVANVSEVTTADDGAWHVVRSRWGGSLLEQARLEAERKLMTMLPHAVDPVVVDEAAVADIEYPDVTVDEALVRSCVVDEVVTSTGMSLATAPVVVGGGRGVGSGDGFGQLERLADLLGGAVGCSRVATNNGWRPHSDQVGQTGTAIAPDIYIACGISGAIQHWAGAKSAKHVLAVNTDAEANMVAKADWAVIGDLHTFVPALIEAIEAR